LYVTVLPRESVAAAVHCAVPPEETEVGLTAGGVLKVMLCAEGAGIFMMDLAVPVDALYADVAVTVIVSAVVAVVGMATFRKNLAVPLAANGPTAVIVVDSVVS
jgi:hypothetical protein